MKLSELPHRDLIRAIEATESSSSPDRYALEALRTELDRRLSAADDAKLMGNDRYTQITERLRDAAAGEAGRIVRDTRNRLFRSGDLEATAVIDWIQREKRCQNNLISSPRSTPRK